ncbi:ATP synthase subunit B family protein [Komagataeibacter medellinensis]|uniref:Uncharacterized protein n=1 Tax=Komagataeibacter medellinensis (strain NBRC 3288 / BCRC 11682 / LMG 1693 / Kondo 51) TaxID=634177 RepID=G2I790_KOMMN|nr:hypothetical protein [Komagataeibacter medellinensis]BAK83987.1 hypothetical protein GLX_15750 [Komagataeibacter medellinensis NBRC 3288]
MGAPVVSRDRLKDLVAQIGKVESDLVKVSDLRWELSGKRMTAEQALQKATEELEQARHMDASRLVDVALGRDVAGPSDLTAQEERVMAAKADLDRAEGYCAEVRARSEEYQTLLDTLKVKATQEANRITAESPEFAAMLEDVRQAEAVLMRAVSEVQILKRRGVPVGKLHGLFGELADRFHKHGDLVKVPMHPVESTEWAQFAQMLAMNPDTPAPGARLKKGR